MIFHKVSAKRLLLTLVFIGVFACATSMAGAATGMALIDITSFDVDYVDNAAQAATESQWYYNPGNRAIYFDTDYGQYTIVGTNGNVCIGSTAKAQNVFLTLNDLTLTSTQWSACYVANQNIERMTLIGTNTLTSTIEEAIYIADNSTCTIEGPGSLELVSVPRSAIFVDSSSHLGIIDGAHVTAEGGASGVPAVDSANSILIGDDAELSIVNDSPDTPTVLVVDSVAGSIDRWVLSGDAFTADSLADPTIEVTVGADETGSILRGPAAVGPQITSQGSLSVVAGAGGQLQLTATGTMPIGWALEGAPAGVSIVDGVLVIAPTVPAGTYHFAIVASNEAGYGVQDFTLSVTSSGTGGNGPSLPKPPATGDALGTLPAVLGMCLSVISTVVGIRRKHSE
jgi:hypothetical protein